MAKPQFKLILFYISYLYFGAMVFYLVEREQEIEEEMIRKEERIQLSMALIKYLAPGYPDLRNEIITNASIYCGQPLTIPRDGEVEYKTWTFYHCLFFAMTIITTVGYGNMNPHTNTGRIFVIFYATIGLPLNGIIFSRFGQGIWDVLTHLHTRTTTSSERVRLVLIVRWIFFLFPGFLIFVLLPAIVFHYFEKWTYGISIYYAFVTLTTIGFGDYAATFENKSATEINKWYYVYQIFVLVWFVLGLGYMIMITQYLIGHYDQSKYNQMDFEQSMSVKEEMIKFGQSFKQDLKSVGKYFLYFVCCRCCQCCRKARVVNVTPATTVPTLPVPKPRGRQRAVPKASPKRSRSMPPTVPL